MQEKINQTAELKMEEILEEVRAGRPIVIVDDRDRENEGDIMLAAERVDPDSINFMANHAKGLICLSLEDSIVRQLGLSLQVIENTSPFGTNFTVSIDHHSVLGRGLTASGRAKTIQSAVLENAQASEFVSPGFVFPLRAVPGGVLKRRGQTEGSVDLAKLAGLRPAAVICEIMGQSGEMLRGGDLLAYCKTHQLKIVSVEDIVQYRLQTEASVRRECSTKLLDLTLPNKARTALKEISLHVYVDDIDNTEHLVFVSGKPNDGCLVRIHSECLTGDVFESRRCDCGYQLSNGLEKIAQAGDGVLIYLNQEGRGIGLANKLRAYQLQDSGLDTVDANTQLGFDIDSRDYRVATQILADLGLKSVRLLTNNPDKVEALERHSITVLERIPTISPVDSFNKHYLETKRERLGHLLPPIETPK